MGSRVSARDLAAYKRERRKIVCITAYDAVSGELAEEAGADVVLVGDSLGNVVLGEPTTHGVTLEAVAYHTRAVRRAVASPLLVADMPFGSYQSSPAQAVESAVALVRAGAEAVKLEGPYTEETRAIVKAGIPVLGHVGMTPQSVLAMGGFRVQGKGADGQRVSDAACALEGAGACAVVLELVPAKLAAQITARLEIPTVGIGAGPECDGEIQVFHDVVGLGTHRLRHARRFAEGRTVLLDGLRAYVEAVRGGTFPTEENAS
jgi:3-methyl-2-oxobutanoate hydroxymethyltransferase